MKIGIIGYGKQSKKIIEKIKKFKEIRKIVVFKKSNFKEKISKLYFTNNIKDLDSLEIIFILSPNNTHFHYIKKFSNKKKYIFCEKPAFTAINEYKYLERLKRFQKERIFFNFNYEFSEYFENLKKEFENKNNGKLINFSFFASHGQAFRNKKNSRKFKSLDLFNKITGNLGIHYINFLNQYINNLKIKNINECSIVNQNIVDTSNIFIKSKEISGNIFLSYASVHFKFSILHFTNAIFIFDNNKIKKYTPRDYFNKKNLFATPPSKYNKKINYNFINNSLEDSLYFFINNVKNKNSFSIKKFNNTINANKLFLDYDRKQ